MNIYVHTHLPNTPILVSNCHPQLKKPGLIGEMSDFKAGARKAQNEPQASYAAKSLFSYIKNDENISKDIGVT